MMLFKVAERSVGFVSTLILARMLTPADFGLVAMAMSVVMLIELMSAFGFDSAIIQRQDADRRHFDTAWTYNAIFGVGTSVLLTLLSVPAAHFYNEPRLLMILPILGVGALAQGLENIGTVIFRKELNFRDEFRFLLSKRMASFIVTIGVAVLFHTYWALVAGIVVGKLLSAWISYRLHPYRPKFSLAASKDLFHFSKWIFISNFAFFLQSKSDNFVLGKTIGAYALGVYNVAFEIAVMPSTELIAPVNRVVFPFYSRLSSDLAALRRKFLEIFGLIALAAFPVALGLACVAEQAVGFLLGPQWMEAVPLLQILAICGLTGALQSNLYLVIVALGKPKTNTLLTCGMQVLYFPSVVAASLTYGAVGAAWAHLMMCILTLIPLVIVFLKMIRLRAGAFFAVLWRPSIASILMTLVLIQFRDPMQHMVPPTALLELLAMVCAGAVTYVVTVLTLWLCAGRPGNSAEADVLRLLGTKMRRKPATPLVTEL